MRLTSQENNVINLEYPIGLGSEVANGQHYMMIDSYESRTALETEGSIKSSIALYIPPNALKTTIAANFEGLVGGVGMAKTGGVLIGGGEFSLSKMAGSAGDMAQKLLAKTEMSKNFFD